MQAGRLLGKTTRAIQRRAGLHGAAMAVRSSSAFADRLKELSLAKTAAQWKDNHPNHGKWKEQFATNGYLVIEDVLDQEELDVYKEIYRQLMEGEIDSSSHRHDLGSHVEQKQKGAENVCQIMWPSVYVDQLECGPLHQRTGEISRTILGDDLDFDFDMLIAKDPETNTPTPWHQDESYWPSMPDKRAVSCWVAMEHTTLDNGCMWFVPGSHLQPLRAHKPAAEGAHVLQCEASEDEGVPQPLSPGSCTMHHGRTLHYSRGNSSKTTRRGFITNYRPAAMVRWERELGYDHGKKGLDKVDHSLAGEVYRNAGHTEIKHTKPSKTA
eukprot:scpid53446/ scgid3887/ Phytanoyl-CoA dioxygenase domain-containing protein 1